MHQLKSKLPKIRGQKGPKEEHQPHHPTDNATDNPTENPTEKHHTNTTAASTFTAPFHILAKIKSKFQATAKLNSGSGATAGGGGTSSENNNNQKKPKPLTHSESKLKEVFGKFENEDGQADPADLGPLMRALGGSPTEADLEKICSKEKLNGPFDFKTFERVMGRYLTTNDIGRAKEVQRAFEVIDRDTDGYVNVSDLKLLLTTSGEKLDPDEFDEWIKEVGVRSDGKVRYEDIIVTL